MDLMNSLSSIVIPRWVKAAIVVLLAGLILAYGVSAVMGVLDHNRSGWIEAGAYVLGVLVPLLIIVLVAGFSEGGVAALTVRTREFLLHILPDRLVLLEENAPRRAGPFSFKRTTAPLRVDHLSGTCLANYRVGFFPENDTSMRALHFRVELNARKMNFNLMLEETGALAGKDFTALFHHTLDGAKHEGYWFHPTPITRIIANKTFICLVGVKKLEDNFLVNPVAKLDVAQDLMLMLRSFINEQPDLFQPFESKAR